MGNVSIKLIHHDQRVASSHEIALRLQDQCDRIADRYGANVKLVERPPGPPVLATIVAEVYVETDMSYEEQRMAAQRVEQLFRKTDGLVNIDTSIEAGADKLVFEVDQQKAALSGVSREEIGRLIASVVAGVDLIHLSDPDELSPTPARLRLPEIRRTNRLELLDMPLKRTGKGMLTLGEVGRFVPEQIDQIIERKNLQRVIYVMADVAGRTPPDVIFELQDSLDQPEALPEGVKVKLDGEGEWLITKRVFRDLGLVLGVAVLVIYALLVYQTGSYIIALILLTSVPLTIIGVIPGFWLLNVLTGGSVGGYDTHILFTATGMIGIIALAGIAVRNAILLLDFIQSHKTDTDNVEQAILYAGALRMRPILLTAGTAMLAVVPVALDPVFAGLAWSLIFGLAVSTLFTLVLVPTIYHLIYTRPEN